MGFWDQLAPPPATRERQETVPHVQQPAPGAWWASPQQQAAQQPLAQQQYQPEETYAPRQAKTALMTDACPACGDSSQYNPGTRTQASSCFGCGYNSRFEQAHAGGMPSGMSDGTPTSPAKQVGRGGNWQGMPTTAAGLERVT
jgi:hypothetical protein